MRSWDRIRRRRFARVQDALTVIVPIPSELKALEDRLDEIGNDIRNNQHIRFDSLRSAHFLSWVLVPGLRDECGREDAPRLVFEACFHGPTEKFLEELHRRLGDALGEKIYRHCGSRLWSDAQGFKDFLRVHAVKPAILFQGYPGLSASMIDNDNQVHWYLHRILLEDQAHEAALLPSDGESEDALIDRRVLRCQKSIERAIAEQLYRGEEGACGKEHPAECTCRLDFHVEPEPWLARVAKKRLVRQARVVPILPVAVVAGGLLLWEFLRSAWDAWRAARRQGTRPPGRPTPEEVEKAKARKQALERIQAREDQQAQNHLTLYTEIKGGWLRPLTLRIVLFGWRYLAKYYFTEGTLAGIEGIHFARWVIVDGGRQWWPAPSEEGRPRLLSISRKRRGLLFLSNYDGSWESYLDNFIDRASLGLTTIWCNTEGFPRSRLRWNHSWRRPRFRLEMGASREEEFKQWVREHQIPTKVWYSRHPDKSVSNIRRNREIRSLSTVVLAPRRRRAWLESL